MDIEGYKNLKKEELISALLEKVSIKSQRGTDNNADHNDCERQSQVKSKCWKKGNWLSFTANIAKQIKYLGVLGLIW